MAQYFLLSANAKTLSLAEIFRASDDEIFNKFKAIRFANTNGEPNCPICNSTDCFECKRPDGKMRWRCKWCKKDFTITSKTLFASHKLHLRIYLAAIAIFINEVKGKSALALSRDLNVQYKTAFVLAHKIREAMSTEINKINFDTNNDIEVDGSYFGGYIRQSNIKLNRVDRRKVTKPNKRVVVVIRQRNGFAKTAVFKSEQEGIDFIKENVPSGAILHADESTAWNELHGFYKVRRINHTNSYSLDGACTNQAESYFARLRRGETGHYHRIIGPYLDRYAAEISWRENNRKVSNGAQVDSVMHSIMQHSKSTVFNGYWK